MKDIPIGEFVTIGNEVFKCVKRTNECEDCDFLDEEYDEACELHMCGYNGRQDGANVMFILYDTIPSDEQDD